VGQGAPAAAGPPPVNASPAHAAQASRTGRRHAGTRWEPSLAVSLACKERHRQPIRGKFTQDLFHSHSLSSGKDRVVIGPDHDPSVDVEQGSARAWLALTITHAQWIARVLAPVHALGNGAAVPGWNQRQFERGTTYITGSGDGRYMLMVPIWAPVPGNNRTRSR
jgi:hypothetical protein